MNSYFRAKNKKILLLVDNTPSYFNSHYLSAVQDEQDEDNTDEEIETAGKIFAN